MTSFNSLVRAVVSTLSDADLADSLCGTAKAFLDLCADLESKPLRRMLKKKGPDGIPWAGAWSLPDAAWFLVRHKNPKLSYYPLGDTAERAVKKAVLDLLPSSDGTGPPGLILIADEELTQEFLQASLRRLGREHRLRQLLANYLFEMAIDYLRRPSKDPDRDSAYDYHFSRAKRALTPAAEHRLRQSIASRSDKSATRFLRFLKEALDNPARSIDAITAGMVQVFRARPEVAAKKAGTARKPVVNVVVGSQPLAKLDRSFRIDRGDLLRLVLEGSERNVTWKISAFEDYLGRPLHSLSKDLLEIAAAVYISDLYRKRSLNLSRRVALLMPVRHPDVWSRAKPLLERAVSELGRDNFTFHFQKKKEKAQALTRLKLRIDQRCVSLFSGGIDSLAGVIWALQHNLDPILVSHYASGALSGLQTTLAAALDRAYTGTRIRSNVPIRPTASRTQIKSRGRTAALNVAAKSTPMLDHVHFSLHRTKSRKKGRRRQKYGPDTKPDSIMFEHLRSFMFLSSACAIALETGVGVVYVFENGPVALNPLLSEGTVNTRTSHPHFINAFRHLVKAVFGVDLRIENPFLYKTKGEVTKILDEPKLRGLLGKSNSCWAYSRVPVLAGRLKLRWSNERHDGLCLPCVLRRTSVSAAGLGSYDANYLIDVFTRSSKFTLDAKLNRETLLTIADLLRFCANVLRLGPQRLLSLAPDLSVYDEGIDAGLVVEMYRRHAAEVIAAFKHLSNRRLRADFKSLL